MLSFVGKKVKGSKLELKFVVYLKSSGTYFKLERP